MWLKWLSHPRCLPVLALVGMLLTAPALNSGLMFDDFIHWSLLTEQTQHARAGSPWGLFNFIDGQADHMRALKASGQAVWWAADGMRLSFWRPLTEWTHWLDYQLWPDSPLMMHVHSTLWYGLLLLLLGRLYKQSDSNATPVSLAVLIFAFSSLHSIPVIWLAARNQLISTCFVILCIGAFARWRQTQSTRQAWLAAAYLTLGLLSAEAALAALGYLAAYGLAFSSAQAWSKRLRPVIPFVLVVLAWRLIYNMLGFGSTDSAFYIDPGSDPVRFVSAAVLRLPALLLAGLFGLPAGSLYALPASSQTLYAMAATATVALFYLATKVYGLWQSPLARFYGLGTLFALVPVCASEPNERLLLNAEIGMSALGGMLLARMLSRHPLPGGWLAKSGRALVGLSMIVHLVIFPLQTLTYAALRNRVVGPTIVDEPLSLTDASTTPTAHVVLLNPPVASLVFYYPLVRQYFGLHNPASTQALVSGNQDLKLTVVDAYTLELSGPKGFADNMSRDMSKRPFKVGDTASSGPAIVTVTAVDARGVPLSARFRFASPLSDACWHFYAWADTGLAPFELPAPGHTVQLPAMNAGKALMKRLRAA